MKYVEHFQLRYLRYCNNGSHMYISSFGNQSCNTLTTHQDRVANTLVRFDQCLSLPAVKFDSRWLPYRWSNLCFNQGIANYWFNDLTSG